MRGIGPPREEIIIIGWFYFSFILWVMRTRIRKRKMGLDSIVGNTFHVTICFNTACEPPSRTTVPNRSRCDSRGVPQVQLAIHLTLELDRDLRLMSQASRSSSRFLLAAEWGPSLAECGVGGLTWRLRLLMDWIGLAIMRILDRVFNRAWPSSAGPMMEGQGPRLWFTTHAR